MAEVLPSISEMEEKLGVEIIEDDEKEPLTKKELRGWYTYSFAVGFF